MITGPRTSSYGRFSNNLLVSASRTWLHGHTKSSISTASTGAGPTRGLSPTTQAHTRTPTPATPAESPTRPAPSSLLPCSRPLPPPRPIRPKPPPTPRTHPHHPEPRRRKQTPMHHGQSAPAVRDQSIDAIARNIAGTSIGFPAKSRRHGGSKRAANRAA